MRRSASAPSLCVAGAEGHYHHHPSPAPWSRPRSRQPIAVVGMRPSASAASFAEMAAWVSVRAAVECDLRTDLRMDLRMEEAPPLRPFPASLLQPRSHSLTFSEAATDVAVCLATPDDPPGETANGGAGLRGGGAPTRVLLDPTPRDLERAIELLARRRKGVHNKGSRKW